MSSGGNDVSAGNVMVVANSLHQGSCPQTARPELTCQMAGEGGALITDSAVIS